MDMNEIILMNLKKILESKLEEPICKCGEPLACFLSIGGFASTALFGHESALIAELVCSGGKIIIGLDVKLLGRP